MILLLGGTSETAPIAGELLRRGCRVLVSMATDNPLEIPPHPEMERRSGRLDAEGLLNLIRLNGVRLLFDATHPYASAVHETARTAADRAEVPYIRFERGGAAIDYQKAVRTENHETAAEYAFSFGSPVLLMTGSRNLAPYVKKSKETGIPLVARVLPHPESVEACKKSGLSPENVIFGRGPFSVEENLAAIRKFKIGVIVTKESGGSGGVAEKIEAARQASCHVVIVERPPSSAQNLFHGMDDAVNAALKALKG